MNLKEKFKRNKGITLIALVVTIIVLLLLAGISITMLTGQNGILNRATQAKIETAKGGLKEEINLMIQKRKIDEATGKKVSLKEDLEKEISGEKIIEEIEGITDACYLTKENQVVTVYEDGTIAEGKIIWDGTSKTKPEIDSEGNWHIKTPEEFKYFADFVNGKLSEEEKVGLSIGETTIVNLENNIDLGARQENGTKTRGENWDSIGKTKESKFKGIFEGSNNIIRGVYIDQVENFTGLFGVANEIKNLTIKDSYVIGGNCTGGMVGIGYILENCHNENTTVISREGNYYAIGGIVGQLNEKMENCSNTGKIIANGKNVGSGASNCGGIAGGTYPEKGVMIKNCTNQGNVIGKGEIVGGIVGCNYSEVIIKDCKNSGEIVGENQLVGGIAGINQGNVEKSENLGKVIGKGERVGGIAGNNSTTKSIIKECKNSGEIVGESKKVGGIAGIAFGNIENSNNIGAILGKGDVGGILGVIGDNCEVNITNCSNEGKIEATGIYQGGEIAVGGIIGETSTTGTSGKIENVYNKGEVISRDKTARGTGGIIGSNSNTFELKNCYNKGTVNGGDGIGAIIGIQYKNNDNVRNSYYLNTLGVKAINNEDDSSKNIIGVSDDVNSYEEFLNWIATKQ